MRGLAALGALLIVGCGGGSSSGQDRASPSIKATGSVAGTILPSSPPTPTARGEPLLVVLQSSSGNPFQDDTVAIIGLDGGVRAKASFKPRRLPDLGNLGPLLTPEARVFASRVYYWDGDGVVRTLGSDGKVTEIARFPFNQAQQELSVAVSPDGSHVMAAILSLPPPPPAPSGGGANRAFNAAPYSIDLYSAAPGKTPTKLTHQEGTITGSTPTQPILQLDTWDTAGPVASYPSILGTQGGSPHQWNGPLVQLDSGGTPIAPIGTADCPPDDLTTDATYVCVDHTSQSRVIRVVATDGRRLWSHQAADSASYIYPFLAPNHSHAVALASGAVVVGADGSSVPLPATFFHSGWLDDQTVVGSQASGKELAYIRLSQPGKAVGLGLNGVFAGGL